MQVAEVSRKQQRRYRTIAVLQQRVAAAQTFHNEMHIVGLISLFDDRFARRNLYRGLAKLFQPRAVLIAQRGTVLGFGNEWI